MAVPFFRPSVTQAEIDEVVACMKSGWLTTGPRTKEFESRFAARFGAKHAIALNSCTAALHLALDAVGLKRGENVIVPAMTFAATAEVVRYFDATPVMVDCEPRSLCIDPDQLRKIARNTKSLRAIIPMHYGGQMADVDAVASIAREAGVPVIEDAAHTLPASFDGKVVGTTADITCFSFYANKCITTGGEGGMALTNSDAFADRMRVMSLHGMSKDAWRRFTDKGSWYYELVAPGFKYNLTDIAAGMGLRQLDRLDELHAERKRLAARYTSELSQLPGVETPETLRGRDHSWHLYAIRLRLDRWTIDRARFIDELKARGITCSVHWMPLHLHPYYRETYGTGPGLFPVAEDVWPRLVSLPLFPGMTEAEQGEVIGAIAELQKLHGR
ncbi:MAG: DegT/DnrJ/EryC1/StrS aminotransferase family protein [Myxococcaceae bacterium]|nr:DegT/DnrJ/EryC1/StrS aminotransferase family protein [Myxococcaceae bacterium]